MAKKLSQIQILRTRLWMFKKVLLEIVTIAEELNNYNYEKDVLGPERVKSGEIRERINSLKKSLEGD